MKIKIKLNSEVEGCTIVDKISSPKFNIFCVFDADVLAEEEVERKISLAVEKTLVEAPTSERPNKFRPDSVLYVSDMNERDGYFIESIVQSTEKFLASFKYAFSKSVRISFGATAIPVVATSVFYPACTYSSLQVSIRFLGTVTKLSAVATRSLTMF